jgi:mevalonate kinase
MPALIDGESAQLLARLAWWHSQAMNVQSVNTRQAMFVLGYLHSTLSSIGQFCRGMRVEVNSQLTPGAGTGSSAAYSVALAAALSRFFRNIDPDMADVEQLAWKVCSVLFRKLTNVVSTIFSVIL